MIRVNGFVKSGKVTEISSANNDFTVLKASVISVVIVNGFFALPL